jgi:hypothetical protein
MGKCTSEEKASNITYERVGILTTGNLLSGIAVPFQNQFEAIE